MKLKFNFAIMCLILLLAGMPCFGHTLFIQCTNYWVQKDFSKYLYFGWGHHLPLDDGISGEKLRFIRIISPGGEIGDIEIRDGRSLHSYPVQFDKVGTYSLAAATNPGFYTIYMDKSKKVHHYIGPKSEIKDAERIFVSLFTHQSSKAYVVCDKPSEEIPAPVGFDWEIMPKKNPCLIKAGDTADFVILCKGKPYSGGGVFWASYNGYSTQFDDYFRKESPVEKGSFSVHITTPGIWYISFHVDEEPSSSLEGKCDMVRFKSTLVFEVFDRNKPHGQLSTQD
jgi:uncharacterized GH25 family protein